MILFNNTEYNTGKDIKNCTRRYLFKRIPLLLPASLSAISSLEGCSQDVQKMNSLHAALSKKYDNKSALYLYDKIKTHYTDLNRRKPYYEKWGMRFNTENAILALAIYRAFRENGCNRKISVSITSELVWETMPVWLFRCVFWYIGLFPDPYSAFVCFTKNQINVMFPSPGWERNYIETENCFGFDVTRCHYNAYLGKEGAPELVTALCDLDYRTAELFPSDIYFKRTKCMGKGDSLCDFRYFRN